MLISINQRFTRPPGLFGYRNCHLRSRTAKPGPGLGLQELNRSNDALPGPRQATFPVRHVEIVGLLSPTTIRFGPVPTAGRNLGATRLVESWFPYIAISQLVAADRRGKDPVYGVHKWFARRPPTLVRALLLASHLTDADREQFWRLHSEPGGWLNDAVVYDPFMGGGTSLVEAARMGASVVGRDVDPIAVAVVSAELNGYVPGFDEISSTLLADLANDLGGYFRGADPDWTPLHWFWLSRPVCGHCSHRGLLYKDLIIATSSGRDGSVLRDAAIHAFCPLCLEVHALSKGRKEVWCCGRRHKIELGTYCYGKYRCTACGQSSTHEQLQTAHAERVLVAVEETRVGFRRRIRTADASDRHLAVTAAKTAKRLGSEFDVPLTTDRRDRRPVNAGYSSTRSLFTPRQWAVFVSAFHRVRSAGWGPGLERELTLMLTGALPCNNVLCGYARDWGRIAPLFSVRGFSLPSLTVELNPFHPSAGRGTLRSARNRMMERANTAVRRAHSDGGQAERRFVDLPVEPLSVDVLCASADDAAGQERCAATICVTDPPYFDFIAYSELSEFFRVWLREPGLSGVPLLPQAESPVESFAIGLGGALKTTLNRLQPGVPLVFTYHSANPDAWTAIGDAFDIANLAVVALWPVLADPHMGHHVAEGNCEWDVVVVARRKDEVTITAEALDARGDLPSEWIREIQLSGLALNRGDRSSFEHAWTMSKPRFARSMVRREKAETRKGIRKTNTR